ncbi:hypothetical protein C8R44DRAFT_740687 [Mycena epipterygia]|nr:hypothetical protein C8R44DRAFT_740687 [Mycena epipterygia]
MGSISGKFVSWINFLRSHKKIINNLDLCFSLCEGRNAASTSAILMLREQATNLEVCASNGGQYHPPAAQNSLFRLIKSIGGFMLNPCPGKRFKLKNRISHPKIHQVNVSGAWVTRTGLLRTFDTSQQSSFIRIIQDVMRRQIRLEGCESQLATLEPGKLRSHPCPEPTERGRITLYRSEVPGSQETRCLRRLTRRKRVQDEGMSKRKDTATDGCVNVWHRLTSENRALVPPALSSPRSPTPNAFPAEVELGGSGKEGGMGGFAAAAMTGTHCFVYPVQAVDPEPVLRHPPSSHRTPWPAPPPPPRSVKVLLDGAGASSSIHSSITLPIAGPSSPILSVAARSIQLVHARHQTAAPPSDPPPRSASEPLEPPPGTAGPSSQPLTEERSSPPLRASPTPQPAARSPPGAQTLAPAASRTDPHFRVRLHTPRPLRGHAATPSASTAASVSHKRDPYEKGIYATSRPRNLD